MSPATCHPEKPHYAKGLCKECYKSAWNAANYTEERKAQLADYRRKNPEKARASVRRWQRDNPGKLRGYIRKWKYGLTPEDVDRILRSQNFQCPICDDPVGESSHVDHCHITGKVRGILCKRCNLMLGHSKDSPETLRRAADYVERSRETQAVLN